MEASKIVFSEAERRLIENAGIILTKNRCIEKIVELFGGLAADYRKSCQHLVEISPAIFSVHPKISKGEKHRELPWVMLDYPRCFDKSSGQLAIRTFFWWGNYFSIQLQASGIFFPPVADAIKANGSFQNWMSGITLDPWDMRLPNEEWSPVEDKTAMLEQTGSAVKLAKKIPISRWESLSGLSKDFDQLVPILEKALSAQTME